MLATATIIFRETMEIAIILSIVLAATEGLATRARSIWLGIIGGVIGSLIVALFIDSISEAMEGMGQEYFNALILFFAVIMIGWTVIWMKKHGRELSQKIKKVGQSICDGDTPIYVLTIIIAISMWREGAEIVLFMNGILSTTKEPIGLIILGGVLGGASGAILGILLYLGLIRIPYKYLFSVTGWLLILLAAGMASQCAGYLISAGALPEIIAPLWDTSHILSEEIILGKILHSMLGYTEQPSLMQVLVYLATISIIYASLRLTNKQKAAA